MSSVVNVTEIRDNLAEILGRVRFGKEIVTVEKKGKPYAVIISPAQYDALRKAAQTQFGTIVQKIHARSANSSPEEVTQDVAQEIKAVRRERYERGE